MYSSGDPKINETQDESWVGIIEAKNQKGLVVFAAILHLLTIYKNEFAAYQTVNHLYEKLIELVELMRLSRFSLC